MGHPIIRHARQITYDNLLDIGQEIGESEVQKVQTAIDILYQLIELREKYLGLPAADGQVLSSDTGGNRSWIDVAAEVWSGIATRTVGGVTAGDAFTDQTFAEMMTAILAPYTAPAIVLNNLSPLQGIREYGNPVAATGLSATTTKYSSDITHVRFRRAALVIHNVAAPNPAGGTETYTDTVLVDDTTAFDAQVSDDGVTWVTSNTRVYTFVYPYYYGVGAQSLTPAQVAGLTKVVAAKSDKVYVFNPVDQVYYFAYPASYGDLTSILDTNGFETLDDWTKRVEDIVGLDGSSVSYNIYEFNNVTTQTDFTNTFKY